MDTVVKNFSEADISKMSLPVIAIHVNPSDYPGKYVARLWDVDKPTRIIVVEDSVQALRQIIPPHMTRFLPSDNDDPIILETWV